MEKTFTLRSKLSPIPLISLGVLLSCVLGSIPDIALAQTSSTSKTQTKDSKSLPKLKDRGAPTGRQRGGASQNNSSGALPKLKDRGAPVGRRRGGASRNDCPTVSKPLTALVPGSENVVGQSQRSISYMASTEKAYPTFWVYIPAFSTNKARLGEFVLQNKAGEDVYRTPLTLPSDSGSLGINLPNKPQYALKLNQEYQWYFQLYCGDPATQPEYFYVDAWIKRESAPSVAAIMPPSASAATTDTPEPQQNFWYDLLTQSSAQSQSSNWSRLLREEGLGDIADEPILRQYPQP
ncbi:MAG: DUF928 domain-containing protein [Thermosynechococcaceae cyanobacterium]